MGIMKQQAQPKERKTGEFQSSLDWGDVATSGIGSGVDWGDADPNLLLTFVDHATRRGMAVSLSATANGTGVSITILDGGAKPKFYANTPEHQHALIERLLEKVRIVK